MRSHSTIARQLTVAIERLRVEQALRISEQRLRAELADTQRLQQISAELIREENVGALYEKIMDAAMSITRSDCASMQMLHPERGHGGELQLLSSRGFTPEAAKFWAWVSADSAAACGAALRAGERVVIPDVTACADLADTDDLRTYEQTRVRAVQTTPLFARSGRMVGMISTHWRQPHAPSERDLRLFDILARQAADLIERAESEAKLREDDRRKDEFLAVLAHELRNPLAPIVNAVEILAQHKTDDPLLQKVGDIIGRQAARLTRLVEDLLEVSRITSGRIQLQREWIVISSVIERAVETVRPLMEQRRHSLEISMPSEEIWLHADSTRLEQVLVNLVNNAAKYTEDCGSIAVGVDIDGRYAVLRVADNGVGIESELLPRIFDLFTQADRSLDRSSGGLGIGLSLVRRLVTMHGGTVKVESVVGEGTEFTVRLPRGRAPADVKMKSAPTTEGIATMTALQVLIVDDNIDAAQSFRLLLEGTGHRVRLAHDGKEGLAVAQEHSPDVVFLDIGLPALDGYQVAARLRSVPTLDGVTLVAITGYGQHADQERAQAAGFDHFLVKPVSFSAVHSILLRVAEHAVNPVR